MVRSFLIIPICPAANPRFERHVTSEKQNNILLKNCCSLFSSCNVNKSEFLDIFSNFLPLNYSLKSDTLKISWGKFHGYKLHLLLAYLEKQPEDWLNSNSNRYFLKRAETHFSKSFFLAFLNSRLSLPYSDSSLLWTRVTVAQTHRCLVKRASKMHKKINQFEKSDFRLL